MTNRVLVISLEARAHPRVATLIGTLSAAGFDVELVPGVHGRSLDAGTYFDLIQAFRLRRGHAMTPSELGCSLSHTKALRRFLDGCADRVVVLEDDVLLDSTSLERLHALCTASRYDDGLLVLGGQEGLEHLTESVHGRLIDEENEVWEVFVDDLKHVHRTVGYQLSRSTAESILALSCECPFVVDDYEFISKQGNVARFYLSNCVGHPRDVSLSYIETERTLNRLGGIATSRPLRDRLLAELRATIEWRRRAKAYARSSAGLDLVRLSSRF